MKRASILGFDRFRLVTCGVALAMAGGGLVACSNRDINSSAAGGHSGAGGQVGTGGTAGTGVGGDSSVSHGGISGTGGINGTGGASGTGGVPGTPMRASYAAGIAPSALALGDFNSDGKLDIAVAYRGDLTHAGGVSVLLNLGQGVYATGTTYATQAPATSIATAHFNGDARPDLVVADSAVTVLLNVGDGTGRFRTPVDYAAAAASIAVADLDGDGRVDVAVGGGAIAVLLGGDGGVLGSPIPVGTQTGSTVAIGDLDDDGKPDLITAAIVSGVIVMRNTGGATFAAPQAYPVWLPLGSAAVSVAAGDLTGDGKADIVESYTGKDTGPGGAYVLLTNPSGVPGTAVGYGTGALIPDHFTAGPRGTGPDMAAVGDIDGDGQNDFVAANSGGTVTGGNIGLSLNHGDGTFAQPKVFLAGTNPVAVAIGDVDGDGQNDIVVANAGSNDVTVLRAPF